MGRWGNCLKFLSVIALALLSGCAASNPNLLAPSTSFAAWTPLQGNKLISSQYCETMLPPTFGNDELSLAILLDIALQNNPTTKQTWAMARSAAAQYGQSLSSFYPNIKFDGTYTRQRASFTLGGPIIEYYLTTAGPEIEVTYTLFDFGQRTTEAEAARESLYYADWTHNQQIQIVLQTVMDDYYSYLYQLQLLKNEEADLKNAQVSLDAANQRFALGLASLGDVAQARTQFLQSKIDLTTQNQNAENSFAQLAADLGLPANIPFKVQRLPDEVQVDPLLASVDELIKKAQNHRPDFQASLANVRSKEFGLRNAKLADLPVVNGNFDVGRYYYSGGGHEEYNFTAEVSLTFPIFSGFYYANNVRNAKAKLEFSRAKLMQKELSIVQEITTSHLAVKTAAHNLKDSEEYLLSAELQFEIALANYKAGTSTILDVLSAQSAIADARTKKANAQRDWFVSLAQIAYSTGSLCACPEKECL